MKARVEVASAAQNTEAVGLSSAVGMTRTVVPEASVLGPCAINRGRARLKSYR
jgi:hypothetical protein